LPNPQKRLHGDHARRCETHPNDPAKEHEQHDARVAHFEEVASSAFVEPAGFGNAVTNPLIETPGAAINAFALLNLASWVSYGIV